MPTVFKPFRFTADASRQKAQWRAFTRDFVTPFVARVQDEMALPLGIEEITNVSSAQQMERLKSILLASIHLETDAAAMTSDPGRAASFLTNGYQYLARTDSFPNPGFVEAFHWTLLRNKNG